MRRREVEVDEGCEGGGNGMDGIAREGREKVATGEMEDEMGEGGSDGRVGKGRNAEEAVEDLLRGTISGQARGRWKRKSSRSAEQTPSCLLSFGQLEG
jgi:hypothetical protein